MPPTPDETKRRQAEALFEQAARTFAKVAVMPVAECQEPPHRSPPKTVGPPARLRLAQARSDKDVEDIVSEVTVEIGRVIRADGPRTDRRESWGVSYEVFVPRMSNLDLPTVNGGITLEGVSGRVQFAATNGGVKLYGPGGRHSRPHDEWAS